MTTPVQEAPFIGFEPPRLGPSPFRDETSVEEAIFPAVTAYGTVTEAIAKVAELSAQIAADEALSPLGKRQKYAEQVTQPLTTLKGELARLEKVEQHIESKAAAMVAVPEPTPATVIERQERLALAQAFGATPEPQRVKLLEAAISGKDEALAEALASAHPAITKLQPSTIATLRRQVTGKRLDPAAVEQLQTHAQRVGATKAAVKAAIEAIERPADRKKLQAAGVATLKRSDFKSDAEKAAWIGKHGLGAWKKLPA